MLRYFPVTAGAVWVETNRGLFQTIDGGLTWADATPRRLMPGSTRGLSALDADHAFLATVDVTRDASTYHIWRTADGGASWSDVALPPVPHDPLCTGAGCVGVKPGDPFAGIDYVDTKTAYVWFGVERQAGLDNYIFGTTDGGARWTPLTYEPAGAADGRPNSIDFDTADTGVAQTGAIISSTSSGWGAWTNQKVSLGYYDTLESYRTVHFVDSTHWYINVGLDYGSHTTYRYLASTDHGRTWVAHTVSMPSVGANAANVTFLSPSAWNATLNLPLEQGLTGVNGPAYTYVTDDGGAHWSKAGDEPAPSSLAHWLDRDNGWTAGGGKLWSSNDRGASWRLLTP